MILPPAISNQESGQESNHESGDAEVAEKPQEAPKPRRRTRKAAPPRDDAGEALEAIG